MYTFAEKHYLFELERNDRINTQASFTVLVAAIYFPLFQSVLVEPDYENWTDTFAKVFAFASMAPAVLFAVSFFGFFGHTYKLIADPEEVVRNFELCRKFDIGSPSEPSARKDLLLNLTSDYAESAKHNRQINQKKAKLLLDCNRSIFVALLLVGIGYMVGASA